LHSFPTRRSSDLGVEMRCRLNVDCAAHGQQRLAGLEQQFTSSQFVHGHVEVVAAQPDPQQRYSVADATLQLTLDGEVEVGNVLLLGRCLNVVEVEYGAQQSPHLLDGSRIRVLRQARHDAYMRAQSIEEVVPKVP